MINATTNSSDLNKTANNPLDSKVKKEELVSVEKSFGNNSLPNNAKPNPVSENKPNVPTPPKPAGFNISSTNLSEKPPESDNKEYKPKKKFNIKMIIGVFILLLILVGAVAGFYLSQQTQDLRQQASEASDCEERDSFYCPNTLYDSKLKNGVCICDRNDVKDASTPDPNAPSDDDRTYDCDAGYIGTTGKCVNGKKERIWRNLDCSTETKAELEKGGSECTSSDVASDETTSTSDSGDGDFCQDDLDCSNEEECAPNGYCKPIAPTCESGLNCSKSQPSGSSRCIDANSATRGINYCCPSGQEILSGACIDPEPTCSEDANCPSGQVCDKGGTDRCIDLITPDRACTNAGNECPAGYSCHCQNGDLCTTSICELSTLTETSCANQGRDWCVNMHGFSNTCCESGYSCSDVYDGCFLDSTPPPPTNPPKSTPTPTPPPGEPICRDVAILDENNQVLNVTTAPFSMGMILKFRCASDDPNNQVTNYEFQVTEPDGSIISGIQINPIGSSAISLNYQIDQYLNHQVECRVCTGSGCQGWQTIN